MSTVLPPLPHAAQSAAESRGASDDERSLPWVVRCLRGPMTTRERERASRESRRVVSECHRDEGRRRWSEVCASAPRAALTQRSGGTSGRPERGEATSGTATGRTRRNTDGAVCGSVVALWWRGVAGVSATGGASRKKRKLSTQKNHNTNRAHTNRRMPGDHTMGVRGYSCRCVGVAQREQSSRAQRRPPPQADRPPRCVRVALPCACSLSSSPLYRFSLLARRIRNVLALTAASSCFALIECGSERSWFGATCLSMSDAVGRRALVLSSENAAHAHRSGRAVWFQPGAQPSIALEQSVDATPSSVHHVAVL